MKKLFRFAVGFSKRGRETATGNGTCKLQLNSNADCGASNPCCNNYIYILIFFSLFLEFARGVLSVMAQETTRDERLTNERISSAFSDLHCFFHVIKYLGRSSLRKQENILGIYRIPLKRKKDI